MELAPQATQKSYRISSVRMRDGSASIIMLRPQRSARFSGEHPAQWKKKGGEFGTLWNGVVFTLFKRLKRIKICEEATFLDIQTRTHKVTTPVATSSNKLKLSARNSARQL